MTMENMVSKKLAALCAAMVVNLLILALGRLGIEVEPMLKAEAIGFINVVLLSYLFVQGKVDVEKEKK